MQQPSQEGNYQTGASSQETEAVSTNEVVNVTATDTAIHVPTATSTSVLCPTVNTVPVASPVAVPSPTVPPPAEQNTIATEPTATAAIYHP